MRVLFFRSCSSGFLSDKDDPRALIDDIRVAKRDNAINAINSLQPPAVYEKLRTNLPCAEIRGYLQSVATLRKQFVTIAK